MKKQVLLLSSHMINDYIVSQYHKLREAIQDYMDLYLLIEVEAGNENFTIDEGINFFRFTLDELNALNYVPIAETIIPGSNHFQLFRFYKSNPQYEYYWNIEYDVYLHGQWRLLFDCFKYVSTDFISSHLERFSQTPEWMWWDSLRLKTIDIPKTEYIKSFNPVYRISNKAMSVLDKILSEGNAGHHEVLIPTVLNHLGFSINDWGGTGEFVMPGKENSVYLTNPSVNNYYYMGSSMRYRPEFIKHDIEKQPEDNKLYHPVKC